MNKLLAFITTLAITIGLLECSRRNPEMVPVFLQPVICPLMPETRPIINYTQQTFPSGVYLNVPPGGRTYGQQYWPEKEHEKRPPEHGPEHKPEHKPQYLQDRTDLNYPPQRPERRPDGMNSPGIKPAPGQQGVVPPFASRPEPPRQEQHVQPPTFSQPLPPPPVNMTPSPGGHEGPHHNAAPIFRRSNYRGFRCR